MHGAVEPLDENALSCKNRQLGGCQEVKRVAAAVAEMGSSNVPDDPALRAKGVQLGV